MEARVDKEIDAFIERRSRQNGQERTEEEAWKASVRRYNASREAERRALWAAYHKGQAHRLRRIMMNLVEHHERQAIKLLEGNQQ